jgi:alpha-beta hydrolase superfamily lysophospholipase
MLKKESEMESRHRLAAGLAVSLGLAGLVTTSSVVFLANHFVEELSLPHVCPDERHFTFTLPPGGGEPPLACQRPVTFRTIDGKILRGDFWAQPQPSSTMIICHGYRVTRETLRPVASLEYARGFNVFFFDFRGHGESESVNTSAGYAEVHDLEAALDVAVLQPETLPGKIVIHGFSMGAAVALLMRPRPEVAAIIADSPYARLDQVIRSVVQFELVQRACAWKTPFRYLRRSFPALSWLITAVSQAVFLARFRHRLLASPAVALRRWSAAWRKAPTRRYPYPPILLIHSQADPAIPFAHARRLAEQARAQHIPLETYFVADASHCGAYGLDPEGYIQALRRFLTPYLGAFA